VLLLRLNTPVLEGSIAAVIVRLPPLAMFSVPLLRSVATVFLPFSVQTPPASSAIVVKFLNDQVRAFAVTVPTPPERPLIVPVPPASSSVLVLPVAVLPTMSPMNTPVEPDTTRLVPLPANVTAWLVPETVPLFVTLPTAL
jgi:hypothetical protein